MVHSERQGRAEEMHPKVTLGRGVTAEGTGVDM